MPSRACPAARKITQYTSGVFRRKGERSTREDPQRREQAVHFAYALVRSRMTKWRVRSEQRQLTRRWRLRRLRLGVRFRRAAAFGRVDVEHGHQGSVIAAAELAEHLARDRMLGELGAREHVVQAPADVALALVAPRRPPGEQLVVVGPELARQVDEPAADQALELRALLGRL